MNHYFVFDLMAYFGLCNVWNIIGLICMSYSDSLLWQQDAIHKLFLLLWYTYTDLFESCYLVVHFWKWRKIHTIIYNSLILFFFDVLQAKDVSNDFWRWYRGCRAQFLLYVVILLIYLNKFANCAKKVSCGF